VKELRFGAVFTYDEVNKWLKASSGDDLMWAYDKLSDRLAAEYSVHLELEEDRLITAAADDSDIDAAERRK
jgi:hypothetical protein